MNHKKPLRRKFEEEPEKEAEVAEATTEESEAPDSHEQFVSILVEMGLTAEQAEAVHQMAMDLVNAGQEPVAEEKTEMSRRRARRAFSRGYGRPRRPRREQMSQKQEGRRSFSGRPAPRGRRNFESQERTRMIFRRQRQRIVELEKQLAAMGQAPAARPLNNAPQHFGRKVKPEMPTQGSPKDRVMQALQNFI